MPLKSKKKPELFNKILQTADQDQAVHLKHSDIDLATADQTLQLNKERAIKNNTKRKTTPLVASLPKAMKEDIINRIYKYGYTKLSPFMLEALNFYLDRLDEIYPIKPTPSRKVKTNN